MSIRIEDNFEDVLMKAATGLGCGKQKLASRSGLTIEKIDSLLGGEKDIDALRKVAPVLQLDADALVAMAEEAWYPELVDLDGLKAYNTPFPVSGYEEMTVNNYLVWHPETAEAVVFDTGASVDQMLQDVRKHQLKLKALFLTHTHRDHIAAYDELLAAHQSILRFAPEGEPQARAQPVSHGDNFDLAGLKIEAYQTNGHSVGGTTYIVSGLERKLGMVGDSLFCLSQGGAKTAETYQMALQNNRNFVLSQSDETLLCPGHGPMTTVANEKARNPFFPEFK